MIANFPCGGRRLPSALQSVLGGGVLGKLAPARPISYRDLLMVLVILNMTGAGCERAPKSDPTAPPFDPSRLRVEPSNPLSPKIKM